MNLCHRVFCSSNRYFDAVEGGPDVDLGDNVLEIGPGYGANTGVLIGRAPHYSAVEIDQVMAAAATGRLTVTAPGSSAVTGPTPACRRANSSSVVCFTMLHHIPTAELQDRLFAEVFRVLRPGGVFAGSDSASSIPFRVLHFRDICNPVSLESLPNRLRANGFSDVYVGAGRGSLALASGQEVGRRRSQCRLNPRLLERTAAPASAGSGVVRSRRRQSRHRDPGRRLRHRHRCTAVQGRPAARCSASTLDCGGWPRSPGRPASRSRSENSRRGTPTAVLSTPSSPGKPGMGRPRARRRQGGGGAAAARAAGVVWHVFDPPSEVGDPFDES